MKIKQNVKSFLEMKVIIVHHTGGRQWTGSLVEDGVKRK